MYIFQEPQKSKRRGRPSKKDKRDEIPGDVMEAMREVNGLRGRRSNKVLRQLFVIVNPFIMCEMFDYFYTSNIEFHMFVITQHKSKVVVKMIFFFSRTKTRNLRGLDRTRVTLPTWKLRMKRPLLCLKMFPARDIAS